MIVILFLTFFLSGCGALSFPILNAPKPPETIYNYEQTFEKNPTAIVAGKKIVVVEAQKQTVTVGYEKKEKALTFWQRFTNWLASWSLITVFFVIALLASGTTTPFIWLYDRYKTFRNTAKKLVQSIEDSKTLEVNRELKTSLSSNLDAKEKKVVDDLRRE